MDVKKTIYIAILLVVVMVLSAIIVACSMFGSDTPVKVPESEIDWADECAGTTWSVKESYIQEDSTVPDYFKNLSTLSFTVFDSVVFNKDKTNQIGPFSFEFTGLSDGNLILRAGETDIVVSAHFSENLLTLTTPSNKKIYLNKN